MIQRVSAEGHSDSGRIELAPDTPEADNARRLVESGADILVVSSGLYQHAAPLESLREKRQETPKRKHGNIPL